jgi:predicted Zn-dependent peptidase
VLIAGSAGVQAADTITNNALYYQPDIRVPMTSLTLVFHGGGSQQETEETAGLADVTASTLLRGTSTMGREMIANKFELLGADVNAGTSQTDFTISVSCFSSSLDETLRLVMTIMNDVAFPQEEIELVRKQKLNALDAALQSADGVLGQAGEYVAYGGTRFGKFGSRKSLGRITRDDVVRYWDNARRSSILYFTCISNLSRDAIVQKMAMFNNNRSADGFVLKPEVMFKVPQGREAFIVASPGATNDRLHWSQEGIRAADERRFDLDLVLDALGSSQGVLFKVLRGEKGWCYGAYAWNQRGTDRPGRIVYYSDPTPETSDKLIPEMLKIIQTFPGDAKFQQALVQRNAAFKNRYAYQLDPRFKLASEVNRDRYGIPLLTREEYYAKIDGVSLATARKMISEVFDAKNMFMVFYGDVERIKQILQKADPSIKITVMEKEVLVQ